MQGRSSLIGRHKGMNERIWMKATCHSVWSYGRHHWKHRREGRGMIHFSHVPLASATLTLEPITVTERNHSWHLQRPQSAATATFWPDTFAYAAARIHRLNCIAGQPISSLIPHVTSLIETSLIVDSLIKSFHCCIMDFQLNSMTRHKTFSSY